MVKKVRRKQRLVAIALTALLALPARADPPGAPPVTRVGYRDWQVDCAVRPCRVSTTILGADGAPVVVVALDGPSAAPALTVTTTLPVFIPDGMLLGVGDDPDRPIPWRVCGPSGCEARISADPDLLAALKRQREGRITITLADGITVRLGVSLLGLSGAWRMRDWRL